MFTIKYRYYELCAPAPDTPAPQYSQCERLDGPYESVSTRYENGELTVYCSRNELSPGMTYGPIGETANDFPRPTLWVMNAQGATIAKYDL